LGDAINQFYGIRSTDARDFRAYKYISCVYVCIVSVWGGGRIFVSVCVRVCVRVRVRVRVRVHARVRVSVCVYVSYKCVHVHAYVRVCVCVLRCINLRISLNNTLYVTIHLVDRKD
jgi:hypothetical protein